MLKNCMSLCNCNPQEVSISDWTQDELDALYRHWKLACPSVEELRERWRQGRSEKMETDRKVEEGPYLSQGGGGGTHTL